MADTELFPPPTEASPEDFGKTFLRRPNDFPRDGDGEPWGREQLVVDFAGGPYRFEGLSAGHRRRLGERFGDMVLRGPGDLPAVPFRLVKADPEDFRVFDLRGWSYTFDRLYGPRAVDVAGLQFTARLEGLGSAGSPLAGVLRTPLAGDSPDFLPQAENFFRLVVAYRLLHLGGVLFHSAGIASRGLGYLFLGHSGAGKTTISRLSLAAGRQVLSDDMNALCPGDGPPRVEKLPFAGDLGRTPGPRRTYPLGGLFRLRQGSPALAPMRRSGAVAFLIGCAPFVNVDPHRIDRLTDNLAGLLAGCPMGELTFAKDPSFWELIEAPSP